MSKFRLMLAALTCAFTTFAAPEIQYLDTYDQLTAKIGQLGHWFVRDAANTRTGQNGDPTVNKGWAIYTWDTKLSKWNKICEEESLDNSVSEALLRQYVKQSTFEQALKTIDETYTKLTDHNAAVATLNASIGQNRNYISRVEASLNATKVDVARADQKADYAKEKVTDLEALIAALDIDTVKRLITSTTNKVEKLEVKVGNLDQTVASVTNVVAGYEGRILALEVTTGKHTEIIAATTNTVKVLESAVSELQGEMATALSDITKLYAGLNSESQRLDVVARDVAGVLTAAKEYTDTSVSNLNDLVISRDTAVLNSSKDYADTVGNNAITTAAADATTKANAAQSAAEATADTNATAKADAALAAANAYTDSKCTGVDTNVVKDIAGELDSALSNNLVQISTSLADTAKSGAIESAKTYTDTQTTTLSNNLDVIASSYASTAKEGAIESANSYTDSKITSLSNNLNTVITTGDSKTLSSANTEAARLDGIIKTDLETRIGPYKNDGRQVTIGGGASNTTGVAAINICSYTNYPSFVYGAFNICLGIDNIVGDYDGTIVGDKPYSAKYSVAIGTSARASKMHSYAWGSQINALAANSTVVGYGLSATDEYSTVIGQASRTIYDKHFDNHEAFTNFFVDAECTNAIFVGCGVLVGSGPGCSHIVVDVLETADPITGMYAKFRENPLDIEVGRRRWSYGKSHGRGTVTLAAIGDGVNDYGLANVYINDRSLADWTGSHIGEPTDKEIYNKGIFGPDKSHCDHDYTIAIGDNAKAIETASSCQAIAIGRDALSAGSATVAVGPNAFAYGSLAAALGWRANAVGDHAIAIGSAKKSGENYFKDGDVNPNSDLCQAVGTDSIAIGFNTKAQNNKSVAVGYYAAAKADGAVQIGIGTNIVANSLRFQNVDVVKDGKVCGTFDSKDLDPKEVDISEGAQTEEIVMKATPHIINTLASTNMCGPGTEIYVEPVGSRNYEIFVPNTKEFREGLPMTFDTEITDCKSLFMNGRHAYTLPAMIKIQQPTKKNVIFTCTTLDEGDDWTPAITNCNIYYDVTAGKFMTQKVGENNYALQGTNLHAAVEFKVEYPISATATWTNDFSTISSKQEFISGTFYSYATGVELTPEKPVRFDGANSWFKIHYKTVNGTANVIRKDIVIE